CLVHLDDDGKKNYTTLYTLTKLFHEMDLVVIAEGAETEEEVRMLAKQGVDRVQGFSLARPMPQDKLLEFYRETWY
ncbi:MAG: EAL domain-containing protein, partial [Clostridia bacterium]|nr:EAL domain-containing protein [Clostridia bacterium]